MRAQGRPVTTLKRFARPLLMAMGVGGVASVWALATQLWPTRVVSRHFVEPTTSRRYRVVTREDHDTSQPAAVLFALHAYATEPDVLVEGYALEWFAVRERGMILVVPEGERDDDGMPFWNATAACCGTGSKRPDDLGYLREVFADLTRRHAIDPQAVLALGVSNGGFMAYRWACAGGSPLSAMLVVSGAGAGAEDPPCAPSKPVTLLHVHGAADETVAYEGGRMRGHTHPSAIESVQPFLRAAALEGPPERSRRRTWLLTPVDEQLWQGSRARVALWTIPGGSHRLRTLRFSIQEMLDFLGGARPRR